MDSFKCPFCTDRVPNHERICPSCFKTLVIGKLTSRGSGVVRRGLTWDLLPRQHSLGRDQDVNDFVISSNLVGKQHAVFHFEGTVFKLVPGSNSTCLVNGEPVASRGRFLKDNDMLQLGLDEFVYSFYLSPDQVAVDGTEGEEQAAPVAMGPPPGELKKSPLPPATTGPPPPPPTQFRQPDSSIGASHDAPPGAAILSLKPGPPSAETSTPEEVKPPSVASSPPPATVVVPPAPRLPVGPLLESLSDLMGEATFSTDLSELFAHALDVVILSTPTVRGFAYLEQGSSTDETEIREMAGRMEGGRPLDREDPALNYPTCHELMERAYAQMYPIRLTNRQETELADFEQTYHCVICQPLIVYDARTGKRQICGVLYADSNQRRGELDDNADAILRLVTQIMTSSIVRMGNSTDIRQAAVQVENSLALDAIFNDSTSSAPPEMWEQLTNALEQLDGFNEVVANDAGIDADSKVKLYREMHDLRITLENMQRLREESFDLSI